jgi:hypothetical protein
MCVLQIYRCWIIYGKSWRIISLPLLLVTANVVLMILEILWDAIWNQHPRFFVTGWPVYSATLALSIAINVYATCRLCPCDLYGRSTPEIAAILVWRVLHVAKGSINKPTRLHSACRILVESGLLFTVTGILNLIPNVVHVPSAHVQTVTDAIVST